MYPYPIYDTKAEWYSQPFYSRANGEALRNFSIMMTDPKHTTSKHPADYTLFEIGEWDDKNCKLIQLKAPINLANGIELGYLVLP